MALADAHTMVMLTPPTTPPQPLRLASAPAVSPTPRISLTQAALLEPTTLQAWSPSARRTCPLCQNDPAKVPDRVVQSPAVATSRATTPPASALLPMRPASADARPFNSFSLGLPTRQGGSGTSSGSRAGPRFVTSPRTTATTPRTETRPQEWNKEQSTLRDAWVDLSTSNEDSERTPDAQRLRRVCKVLVPVVNQIEDPLMRQVMVALSEELFVAVFKDYVRLYEPQKDGLQGKALPRIAEEQLSNLVPFFSVVQNLRETAKDAILRKLELEAQVSGTAAERSDAEERRAIDEVKLREELRHAHLLAETYQVRTVELEKLRMDLENKVRQLQLERSRDELQRRKLSNEVKRLRAEAEAAKVARAAWEAERRQSAALGRSTTSTRASDSNEAGRRRTTGSSFGRALRPDPFGGSRSSGVSRNGGGAFSERERRSGMLEHHASPREEAESAADRSPPTRREPRSTGGVPPPSHTAARTSARAMPR